MYTKIIVLDVKGKQMTITLGSFIEILAIILSIVALLITIIVFFASLKFYRDGVKLQNSANDVLTTLKEKTEAIQKQVGGLFEKTLDAAIGNRFNLDQKFDEINKQLEESSKTIINTYIKQLGDVGNQESDRIKKVVDEQLNLIKKRVETTRKIYEILLRPVEELDVSDRVKYVFKIASIKTIGDLVRMREEEMLKYRNLGRKALLEIKQVLEKLDLYLGMNVNNI